MTTCNVVNHGAVGDGVHDDAPAIQAAFDGGHKEVFIPDGQYRLTRTLRVDSFTSIVAAPMEAETLQ
jgi:polygalacturonase